MNSRQRKKQKVKLLKKLSAEIKKRRALGLYYRVRHIRGDIIEWMRVDVPMTKDEHRSLENALRKALGL